MTERYPRVIIAGSRDIEDPIVHVEEAMYLSGIPTAEVVSGGCRGVDQAGEQWAKSRDIPIVQFLPDWDRNGRAAGPIRNVEMAKYGDFLVAIRKRDGISRGTDHMIETARAYGLPMFIHYVQQYNEGSKR